MVKPRNKIDKPVNIDASLIDTMCDFEVEEENRTVTENENTGITEQEGDVDTIPSTAKQ